VNVIECSELAKSFGKVAALSNLSLTIEPEKITGIIGPNGAGKTTFLKIISGFIAPSSGEIKVFAENPFNSLLVSVNVIYLDDSMPLPAAMPLADILNAAGAFYPGWDGGLAKRLLAYFEINPRATYPALSRGKKSTFTSILGIATRCPLTMFDEPTTGMDAAVRKDFYRALLKDYLQHPRTILLSSHLLNEIQDILEDVLLINAGTKVLHQPVAELKEYAVGLRGRAADVRRLAPASRVIRQENFGKDSIYAVVVRSEGIRERAAAAGVETAPVPAADLCVYLTAGNKGGIDDVFSQN
jgi:ABC-2 type transport system ATP-binding protein